MASTINFNNHIKRFSETMRGVQRILFVGTGCDMSQYPALAGKAWKCIYTTSQAANLAEAFSRVDRQVRPIYTKVAYDRAGTKLDQKNPLLIYLNGYHDPQEADGNIELEMERRQDSQALRETLSMLIKSELLVELVIVGYEPANPTELQPSDLYYLVRELSDNRITFYGMTEAQENDRYIKDLVKKGIATVFLQDLGEALNKVEESLRDDDFDDAPPVAHGDDDLKNTVYINGVPVAINKNLCYDFCKYGRVLSVQEMATGTISPMMQVDYFYQFLKRSPNAPQWYGYASRNGFSVVREYEAELYDAVEQSLSESSEIPVVLEGQTSSGKSVALAALAYRIFQERKYPILFVNNPEVTFASNTPAANALDNILKEMRDKGGRVLVILDWSIYNLQRNDIIRKLSDHYNGRGHKVLFVASAIYAGPQEKRYRIIQASGRLTDQEKTTFKNLVVHKGKLPQNKVERWMEKHSDEDGLLSMLYRLVYELHPQLERGVKQEITKALEDTRQGIMDLEDPLPVQKQLSSIAQQLIALGLAAPPDVEDPKLSKEAIADSLRPFSESLAVASLFKLRMPITMAMHLLNIPECNNRQRYRDIVFGAPWINYAMDDDKYAPGEYYVSFRDSMDARIYLASINKDEKDQMQIVAQVILTLKGERDSFYSDEVRFLERLIRLIGPNSDDQNVKANWYNTYGQGCQHVIEALAELREDKIIEPSLVAQEITYIREYYGSDLQTDLKERIEWLEKAVRIAREVLELRERPNVDTAHWQQGLIDSITVENIIAELQLERCYQDAAEQGIELEKDQSLALYSYDQRSQKLLEIIRAQPESSYAYTTLLSCFAAEYADDPGSTAMYAMMSEVLEVVDATAANIPRVELNEYYQRAKTGFLRLFDRACGSDRAESYFQQLLDMGSAVGIYLKASMILRKNNIQYNTPLTPQNREACKEALDLLEDEKYARVVNYHAGSQYMRLQLTWLYYNGSPVFERERQRTRMTRDQWLHLYQICSDFKNNIIERQPEYPYIATVYYIMALACAQCGDYESAAELWRSVSEEDFYNIGRQYTWHVLCEPDGTPMTFIGTFNVGHILPERRIYIKEMNRTVLYPSLQSINKSDTSGEARDLCIGTSFRGFSAFAKNWKAGRQ